MDGKQIGLDTAARINVLINEMREACAGDPIALIEAASVVSHLLSMSNEDAPVTQVIREMRREAILALAARGLSDEKIRQELLSRGIDISRSRVQQIRTNASEGERKKYGLAGGRRKPTKQQPVPMDTLPGFDAA